MLRYCTLATLLAFAAAPAIAQTMPGAGDGNEPVSTTPTNVTPGDTHTLWSPRLPRPSVSENAPPSAFVQAAQVAIAAGRTGEAQEAIERAETRALDRSVRPSRAEDPSHQTLVQQLSQARLSLASGDRTGALHMLDQAMANPDATQAD